MGGNHFSEPLDLHSEYASLARIQCWASSSATNASATGAHISHCWTLYRKDFMKDIAVVEKLSRHLPHSSTVLFMGGILLVILGLYFLFVRPPLLPEDPRYMGTSIE